MTNLNQDPMMHHADIIFRAATAACYEGKPPVQLTFDTRNEAVSLRHTLQRWRHSQGPSSPYYNVTLAISSEPPWTLTFRPRFSNRLAAQIAELAKQVKPEAPASEIDLDALLRSIKEESNDPS